MSSSDSEAQDSQSQFNNLNKLNPDAQQDSNSIQQKPAKKKSAINEQIDIKQETKTIPVHVQHPRIQINLPKKQLTLVKQNKPRLIIDHMILKDFKSYAGIQKIGPFHKNFTSIVGPNGSGKSNLIQSMLFIFGFSASWMRLKNLHQLIHNSSNASNISSAAVEVHFKKILDNNDGSVTQIPSSQFFIRRTVNQQSVSKYFLNGNDSTQLQIKTKLKSQGIDLTNNRFLILQGEVQQISQMKQKSGDLDKPGFLEYLQEIIGSSQFIQRIQNAVKQFNENQEIKHEKGERMKIVENQLKGMTSAKQEAIKYVKKQKKIFQIQSILQQVLKSNSVFELKKVRERIDELQKIKERIIKEQKQKMIKQSQRVMEIKRIRAQNQKYQKQIQRDNAKLTQLSAQDKNLKNQITYNSQDRVKYQKKLQELNRQFTQIIEESDQIKKNLPDKQDKLAKDKAQIDKLKSQLSKFDKPELRQKIKYHENQIKKTNLHKNGLNQKKNTLKNEVEKIQQSAGGHQHKWDELKRILKENVELQTKMQMASQAANRQINSLRQTLQKQSRERNNFKIEIQSQEMMLKENNSQRHQQGQFNNMFNHIMKANIPGVIGRLGDLGTIPRQYDEIITTSCSRLDNIVTQNLQSASKVLQFLKRNNLGRATCIILDKINHVSNFMNNSYPVPQNAVRLFDIIKPQNEKARLAFYFSLSNTLYCENIDRAAHIALGDDNNRRRVIAKRGSRGGYAIYQMNGVINSVIGRRGGFQKKTAQQKNKNQNQDREIERKIQQYQKEIESKNRICAQIENEIKGHESKCQSIKPQIIVLESKIKEITEQINDIERMMQRNKSKKQSLQNMQRQIKDLQNQIEKVQSQIQKLQKGLLDVENEQKKCQTAQITQKRQRYKVLRQDYAKFQKQVQKQQVLLSTVQKRIKENQTKKQSTQKSIQKLQIMIQKARKDMEKMQEIGTQLFNNIQRNKQKVNEMKQKQEQIKKVLDADEEIVKQSRKKIEQAKQNVDNAKREIRKAEQDLKFAQSQLERIRKLYTEMTSTYDFMNDIEEIQSMNVEGSSALNSSVLDMSIQNTSLEVSNPRILSTNKKSNVSNQGRIFDVKKLQKSDPLIDLSEDDLDAFLLFDQKLRSMLKVQSDDLKKMEGKNLQVISQYRQKFKQYKIKLDEFQKVKEKQNQLKKLINELKQQRFNMFRQGFAIINSKLKQVYQLLTNGGDAELQLIDSLDPFSDGVNFSVRPPKKAWKQINKLSGGQKTLSSLSLIFALHYYKPTPLYFMDEIDAALDFKNVSIVGDYIKKRTKDAQFIIISLRNNMFDLADKLVGVYKTFDQTKVINLAAAKFLAKKQLVNDQQKKQKENQNINIPKITEI